MIQARETIYAALFAVLQKAAGIQFLSRKPIPEQALGTTLLPALEVLAMREIAEMKGHGLPVRWRIELDAVLYVGTSDTDSEPDTALNSALDAVETAIRPGPDGKLTLGNAVYDCRFNGPILKDPGFQTGIGAAGISIEITTTS